MAYDFAAFSPLFLYLWHKFATKNCHLSFGTAIAIGSCVKLKI